MNGTHKPGQFLTPQSRQSPQSTLGREKPHEKKVPRMTERGTRRILDGDRQPLRLPSTDRRGPHVTAQLNHTIVYSADRAKSARFLAEILGLPAPTRFGPF